MSVLKQVSRSSYKPIYIQISDQIREMINSGELALGSRIWSEHEIMNKYDVSRNTAQKAIESLEKEGIVSRQQGMGSFVTQPKVAYGLQELISFTEETIVKGLKPTSKVLRFGKEHPDPKHANNLKISTDDWVYELERIRMANNYPISHQISFLPVKLCPELERYDFESQSLYEILQQDYNHVLSWKKIIVSPISAGERFAEMFDIPQQTPLLLTDSVTFLVAGIPIESNINIFLSERYEFTVISQRGISSKGLEIK
ncbi:MAG: GntR family transcriptional regulator [Pelolinea sp.]|nr:GntR family transcriptional regulator [Pelolinea sp.]